jgi:hypothetical protein
LEVLKTLLETTTVDMQDHFDEVDEQLDDLISRTVEESSTDPVELQILKDEKQAAKQCLLICRQLSDQIDKLQSTSEPSSTVPEQLMANGLQECKNSINATSEKVDQYIKTLRRRYCRDYQATRRVGNHSPYQGNLRQSRRTYEAKCYYD